MTVIDAPVMAESPQNVEIIQTADVIKIEDKPDLDNADTRERFQKFDIKINKRFQNFKTTFQLLNKLKLC